MGDTVVMDLPDGRELAWLESGDPKGPAVFVFHGTPGSRLEVSCDHVPIISSGVRFIAVDRPGYGHSAFQRGRRLSDWASDVTRLADHLKIDGFSVIARFIPERVLGAGIVSGVGPLAEPGAEKGMMGFNRAVTRLARRSQYFVYPTFALSAAIFRRWPELALRAASGQMPKSDIEIMSRPSVRSAYVDTYRRAPSTSALAAAQDFALFASDWGFRLDDINVPVNIWHGDDDRNVPISHGRLQAERIPGARLHECPGEGHLLVIDRLEEILRTVSAQGAQDV
jgi:pimeloyl-ACP methyl ester carboxylesterase